jgi:predicted nucleic acid-binding protein
MILVDTSIWIDHFRSADRRLADLLERGEVLGHPFIIGELACGNLRRRAFILELLERLPRAVAARPEEVMHLIEGAALHGKGLGWTDCHLLASARLTPCDLWTKDRPLLAAATVLGVAYAARIEGA